VPKIIDIGNGFWNIRGELRIGGVLNVGTHSSLVKRASGKYVLLDACALDEEKRNLIDAQTQSGELLEAVLHLHPFHTLFVKPLHALYPRAKLYGTKRHHERASDLPWQPELTNDPALHALFNEDFDFSVPRGVDFIPSNQNLHFASVLVFHRASHALHVDDTLNFVRLPSIFRALKEDMLAFHPSLARVLERRAGAVADFRVWARDLIKRLAEVDHLCAAHTHVLRDAERGAIAARVENALQSIESKLASHERRHG
jgi:hypothetical protein